MIFFNILLLYGLSTSFSHTSRPNRVDDANTTQHPQSFPQPPARLSPQTDTQINISFDRIRDTMIRSRSRFQNYVTQKKRLFWLMSTLIFGCALLSFVEHLLKIKDVWVAQDGTLTISASMTGTITIPFAITLGAINSILAWMSAYKEHRMIRDSDIRRSLSITNIINTASVSLSAISFLLLVIFNTRDFPVVHDNLATAFFTLTNVACGAKLRIHQVLKNQGVLQKRYPKMWVIFGMLILGYAGICVMNFVDPTKSQAFFSMFEYLFALGAILHAGDMWHMFEEIESLRASTVAALNIDG